MGAPMTGILAPMRRLLATTAIVGIAIIFDRISQAYGQRLQKHRSAKHD